MTNLESSYFYEPFTVNIAGFIVPMITGLLSACSSGLIIYIIIKSQQKLSTTYHRLMAFMSFFDIVSSVFIALGTIMLPSDTIYKIVGPMLGNGTTCKIQGWLIMFGLTGGTSLNACLAWYFVCRFAFRVSIHKMKRCIEPLMYGYTMIITLLIPSFFLAADLIHPNAYDCFCTIAPYPESCDEDKWYDWSHCTWKDGVVDDYFNFSSIAYIGIVIYFVLIVVGMCIILWIVKKNNCEIVTLMSNESSSTNGSDEDQQREVPLPDIELNHDENTKREQTMIDLKHSRVLIFQALMYIFAFFLTWVLNVLSGGLNITNITMDAINSVLFPLQGFWNLLIFLYDKSYLIRQESKDEEISFWQMIKRVITTPEKNSTFSVTNISAVVGRTEEQFGCKQEQPALDMVYEEISEMRGDLSRSAIKSSTESSKLMLSWVDLSSSEDASVGDHKRMALSNIRSSFKKHMKNDDMNSTEIQRSNMNNIDGHEIPYDDEGYHWNPLNLMESNVDRGNIK
jgi:hypothetical protein